MLDRKTMPDFQASTFKLPAYKAKKLSNGLEVYYCQGAEQDVCKIEIVYKAGSKYQQKSTVASLTSKMLKEGTASYSSEQIAEGLDAMGSHIVMGLDKDVASITLYTLSEHLEQTMAYFFSVITEPVFPEQELEVLKSQEKNSYLVNITKGSYLSRQLVFEKLFDKESAYCSKLIPEDFDNVLPQDLKQFFENQYKIDNAFVIVSGKVEEKEQAFIDKQLSDLNRTSSGGNDIENQYRQSKHREVFVKQDNAIQSAIRISGLLPHRTHKDYPLIQLTSTILGGYFGSRLMANIREDKGYTYGIGAGVHVFEEGSMFSIATEVGTAVTNNALKEIYKEVKLLQNELVSPSELERVKNYLMGSMVRNFDGAFLVAEMLKSAVVSNVPFTFYNEYCEALARANPQDVKAIANTYFKKENWLEIVVGKK